MRIIGSNDAQVPGQTILWLIARASELNRFNELDVKKLFAATPSRGFNTLASANPGVLDGINVKSLLSLLNLSDEYIRYSCFKFYLPLSGDFPHSSYENDMRLCPICAKQGVHLTLHQLNFWKKCPIHKARLLSTCVKCGHLLGKFSLQASNSDDVYNPYRCRECGHIQIELDISNPKYRINRLNQLLSEYEDWSNNIKKAFKKTIFFDDQTVSLLTIHSSPYLVARPKWVDQCLPEKLNTKIYLSQPEKHCVWKRVLKEGGIGIDVLNICADIVLNYADVYKSYLRDLFNISEDVLSQTIMNRTSRFCQWKSDGYSVWAEAYYYLENYIKSYKTEIEKISGSTWAIEQHTWPGNLGMFSSWLNGPVQVALKLVYTKKEHQSSLLLMLSKYWVRHHLYSQYCNYLGKIITQDLSRNWFYNYSDMDKSMLWIVDMNKYFFHGDGRKTVFEVSSQNMTVNYLQYVYKEGFFSTYEFEKSKTIREQIKRITSYISLDSTSSRIITSALESRSRA